MLAHFNGCLRRPGDTRHSALVRPEESPGNDSAEPNAQAPQETENLIAVWSPAAMLPRLPGSPVATRSARREADRIQILACVQNPCSCTMMFQRSSPVSGDDNNACDWPKTSHGEYARDLTKSQQPSWEMLV